MSSLKQKLFAAALLNPGLVYLLGGGSPLVMRWFDVQFPQYSTFPAVVVTQVSDMPQRATSGRMPTRWARAQFEIYGTGTDSQNADAIVSALESFFDTFSGDGVTGRTSCPNYMASNIDFGIAATQPLTYMRKVDFRIFWNPNS
jgi:hypothetical protein